VWSLVTAKSGAATRLRADVEEYHLFKSEDMRNKATIQILDHCPEPKRYVLVRPLSTVMGSWLLHVDPNYRQECITGKESQLLDVENIMLERLRAKEDREPTPEELSHIEAHIRDAVRKSSAQINFATIASTSTRRPKSWRKSIRARPRPASKIRATRTS